jgi:hypothetical protein
MAMLSLFYSGANVESTLRPLCVESNYLRPRNDVAPQSCHGVRLDTLAMLRIQFSVFLP